MGERKEYMRNQGFTFITDVGHRFMDDTRIVRLGRVKVPDRLSSQIGTASPSAVGLNLVSTSISEKIGAMRRPHILFKMRYGVSSKDYSANRFNFDSGLGDFNFTSHFAPAVANTVVQTFLEEKYITQQQYDTMTLGDWADMIGSVWFGEHIMDDMALTSNGKYQTFGNNYVTHSKRGALKSYLEATISTKFLTPLFEVGSQYEEATDQTYLTASVSPELRRALRKAMKKVDSPGCPAARRGGTLPITLLDNDPHAKRAIERGDLVITARDESTDRVRFKQDYTPIDRALDSFAYLLDEYDRLYGTPYWRPTVGGLVHERKPKTNVLIHQGHDPFINQQPKLIVSFSSSVPPKMPG